MAKRKASKKRTSKKKTTAKKVASGIELKDILPKGMKGAKARRILRKAGFGSHEHRARWTFTKSQAEKAKALLSG